MADWQDEALCAQTDPDLFFPEKGGNNRRPIAVCRECPVRIPCLDDALRTDERWGIRGGLSPLARQRLLRDIKAS